MILSIHRPAKQTSQYFIEEISKLIDQCSKFYSVLLLGDFNLEPDEKNIPSFIQKHNLYNLTKSKCALNFQMADILI